MNTWLPKALELKDGNAYPIRWDFRAVLDLFEAMNDPDATDQERGYYLLVILYEDFEAIPKDLWEDAAEKGLWFLNGGSAAPQKKTPKLMDWEQDFPIIIPAINRIAGCEVRELPSLHWWTFLGYYQEIGDCTFAQVVNIRNKQRRGKSLEKYEREYYERNRELVDMKQRRTTAEETFLAAITKKKGETHGRE